MRRDTVARIELEPGSSTPARFLAQAKLATDEPGHPYGQFSVAVECIGNVGRGVIGWMAPLGDEIPADALRLGAGFDLYVGPSRIGRAEIVAAPPRASDLPLDEDLFVGLDRPPRSRAA